MPRFAIGILIRPRREQKRMSKKNILIGIFRLWIKFFTAENLDEKS
jgi:hypothetical protein